MVGIDFLLFCKAVLKQWWSLLSCAIFTVIGFYVALTNKNNAWVARGILTSAACLLLWSCFLAWRNERQNRISLEKSLEAPPSLKERLLQLSQSTLDFLYERTHYAPSVSEPYFEHAVGSVWLKDMRQHDRETNALRIYERETLEMFAYKYLRTVISIGVSAKESGLDTSELNRYVSDLQVELDPDHAGLLVPINNGIKQVGKHLGILADQIEKP